MSGFQEKDVAVTTSKAVEEKAGANAKILTINRPCPSRQSSGQHLSTIHDVDSAHSMTPPVTPNNEKAFDTTYTTPRDERDMYSDLEAQALTEQKTQASVSKTGLLHNKCKSNVDSMWPGRKNMKAQKKAAKQQRSSCACWVGLSKTYKGLIITFIILAVLGIALGIGFGLSKKVGGTINDGHNKHVPTK